MTCSVCDALCSTSKNGLCGGCRAIARRPKGRRPKLAARRWLAPRYQEIRQGCFLRGEQIAQRAQFLSDELRHLLPRKTILYWDLDNPYMSEDARRVMVNDVLRYHASCAKKPVQSVQFISVRKQAA